MFQSTPTITGGRFEPADGNHAYENHVSIHAHHYWRAIRGTVGVVGEVKKFQSTPTITGGRFDESMSARSWRSWFQSTPTITGGRFPGRLMPLMRVAVSIHAHHYWRAIHDLRHGCVPLYWFQSTPTITGGRFPSQLQPCTACHFTACCANRVCCGAQTTGKIDFI